MAPWECVCSVQRRKHYARFCSTQQPLDRTGEEASQLDFHPRKCKTRTEVSSLQAFWNQPHRHMWPTLPLNIISTAFKGWLSGLSSSLPILLASPSLSFFCCCIQRRLFTPEYISVSFLPTLVQEKRDIFSFYSVSVLFHSRLSSSLETYHETFQCVKKSVEGFKVSLGGPCEIIASNPPEA